jgi:DNA-binding protein YbaB
MAVPGLPSADSLLASIAALRRTLTTQEAGFRASVFTANSTDGKVTATANGMVELLSVGIALSAWPPAAQADLVPSLRDACSRALTQANNDTKPKASANAAAYTLAGIPNFNQPPPATPDFQSSDADFTALIRAQEPVIAAKRFQGISGPVTAEVDGGLNVTGLDVAEPVLEQRETLEMHVVLALNLALDKAKRLFEDAVKKRIDDGLDPKAVTSSAGCLWAHGSLELADRVKVKRQDGTFAPVVNAGSTTTNVGVEAQTGDLWSRSSVVLRDRSRVNGNLRTMSTLTRHNQTVVTGTITENGFILRIPMLTLTVTFPGTNQGPVNVAPDTTKTIAPGAFADVTVGSRATLFLSKGTYFFNSFTVEPQAKISCTSTTGQVVVHVKNGFTFRGSIIEKTGGRPKFFVSVHGSNLVALGAPFTGTLVALSALVDFATVGAPGHTGAFYAKDIRVQPDNTIVHFPFNGPPAFTST